MSKIVPYCCSLIRTWERPVVTLVLGCSSMVPFQCPNRLNTWANWSGAQSQRELTRPCHTFFRESQQCRDQQSERYLDLSQHHLDQLPKTIIQPWFLQPL